MKITRAAEYAVRIVLYLAEQSANRVVNRVEIAEEMDVPYQFLGKIGSSLAASGVIRITQGPKGGYALKRPPAQVTLLEVIEAAQGEILLNECLIHDGFCSREASCSVHTVWEEAQKGLREKLSAADFETLAAAEQRRP